MKKESAKAPARPVEMAAASDLAQAGAIARQKVINAMPGVIDAIIGKAMDGSYLHANFLVTFAGLNQSEKETDDDREDSLAELLLKRLDQAAASDEAHVVESSSNEKKAEMFSASK